MKRNIVVIAGPAGTGKNSIISGVISKVKNAVDLITSTTRAMRPGEVNGVDYFFLTNEEFENEIKKGNVLEKYYREDSKTWYGSLKSKINEFVENYDLVIGDLQIVGAKALKENYNAVTIFVLPESDEVMEKRIRSRSAMSDLEWQERLKHTKREMEEDLPFYDYKIRNKEGDLENTIQEVLQILEKEGIKFERK